MAALTGPQKDLMRRYNAEYRGTAALQASAVNYASADNDVAVSALAAQHALSRVAPANFTTISAYLTSHGLTPP